MQFSCDSCGLCCKQAYLIPELSELIGEDGQCMHFADNKCLIYDIRPIVCNVNRYYENFVSEKMTKKEFHQKNYESCLQLKNKINEVNTN